MPTQHGRNTQLLLQRQATLRDAPAVPAAFKMKSTSFEMSDGESYEADGTIQNNALAEKRDEADSAWAGKVEAILCLNDIGQWLTLLLGTPVTSGAGPYTHTFTLDLADRPTALLELGYLTKTKFRQWLGCAVSGMSWNIKEAAQNMSIDLLGALQTSPHPGAAFDAAPTAYAKNRACKKAGNIYDVDGANTLGRITTGNIAIALDVEGQMFADGEGGYGAYDIGQPTLTGEITALLFDGSLMDYAEDHTSVPLELVSTNAAGDASLTVKIPAVEFDKPTHSVSTSRGMVQTANWMAHADANPVTIELVNGIPTY